jgi:hypothetical protein
LRQISGDSTLILQKIEAGSVKLVLQGSQEGLEKILALYREGQLTEMLGIPVQDVRYVIQKTTDNVQLKINLKDPDLDDEELEVETQSHFQRMRDISESIVNSLQSMGFLVDGVVSKTIELELEVNGRTLNVTVSSQQELSSAIQAAEEFIKE